MSNVCAGCCSGTARPFGGMDVEKVHARVAVLLGGLLAVSIAVKAGIILAERGRLSPVTRDARLLCASFLRVQRIVIWSVQLRDM